MPAFVAEHLDHEVGGAVYDLRPIEERRRRIDEAAKPHDPHHLVEVAERDLDLGQKVDRAGARRALALLDRYGLAELAFGDQGAGWPQADLARNHEQRPGAHKSDIVG